MARGVTPRPRRGALQKIPFTWQTASDREAAHILAHHNEATDRRKKQPEASYGAAALNPVAVAGTRTGGKMRIRGGVFAPKSNVNSI